MSETDEPRESGTPLELLEPFGHQGDAVPYAEGPAVNRTLAREVLREEQHAAVFDAERAYDRRDRGLHRARLMLRGELGGDDRGEFEAGEMAEFVERMRPIVEAELAREAPPAG